MKAKRNVNFYKVFKPKFPYQDMIRSCERAYGERCHAHGECWVYTRAYNASVAGPEKRIHFHALAGAVAWMRRHGSASYHVTYDGIRHVKRFGEVFCAVNRRVYMIRMEVVGD